MYRNCEDFDGHVLVTARQDTASRLAAYIAIHNEIRAPAIVGCRILKYASQDLAIKDVLRLSHGMTYKSAIANIPYGGGKTVIIADSRTEKATELLCAMEVLVQSLKGRYITSFDSGTTLDDIRAVGEHTDFAVGTLAAAGNASGSTANGVYYCMRAAAEQVHGMSDLAGLTVAIQGVGNAGARLARRLAADGAWLIIADVDEAKAREVADETGATVAGIDDVLATQADIAAPCAPGGILSVQSILGLKAKIIVGGANYQLATSDDDARLQAADILYCPDYCANAGGIIDLHYQRSNWTSEAVDKHVASLAATFHEIVGRSEAMDVGIADPIACERFQIGDVL